MKKLLTLPMAALLAGAFSVAQAATTCTDTPKQYGAITVKKSNINGDEKCVAYIYADSTASKEAGDKSLYTKLDAFEETVDYIVYKRGSMSNNKNQTITLPFSTTSSCTVNGAEFYPIGKDASNKESFVDKNKDNIWIVRTDNAVIKNDKNVNLGIIAGDPYIVKFTNGGEITFSGCDFEINTRNVASVNTKGSWSFVGTFGMIKWDEGDANLGSVYGLGTAEDSKYGGKFVKAKAGASIPPMRAFLKYNKPTSLAKKISIMGNLDFEENPENLMLALADESPATEECFQDGDGIFEVKTINGRVTACIDDNGIKNAGHFSIPEEYLGQTVDSISYNRKFTPNTLATAIFPFDLELHNTINGTSVGRFVSIGQQWDKQWVATFDWSTAENNLKANTPYILSVYAATELRQDSTLIFCQSKQVACATIQAASDADAKTNHENWNFVGTYEKITFNESTKKGVYGFVAKQDTVDDKVFSAGQFVKAGTGASVPPMRAYLKYNAASALAKAAAGTEIAEEDLPESIIVKFIDGDGNTLSIGQMNTITGEITMDENKWFDMKGRVLNKKPTAKGTYYNKGQKVIIK